MCFYEISKSVNPKKELWTTKIYSLFNTSTIIYLPNYHLLSPAVSEIFDALIFIYTETLYFGVGT